MISDNGLRGRKPWVKVIFTQRALRVYKEYIAREDAKAQRGFSHEEHKENAKNLFLAKTLKRKEIFHTKNTKKIQRMISDNGLRGRKPWVKVIFTQRALRVYKEYIAREDVKARRDFHTKNTKKIQRMISDNGLRGRKPWVKVIFTQRALRVYKEYIAREDVKARRDFHTKSTKRIQRMYRSRKRKSQINFRVSWEF